ncbi:TPA: hypothetical protein ACGPDZ_003823 [Klebsiella variicola]
MGNLTRTEVAKLIRDKLLNGSKLTPKQFDRILHKHGNHERSRVLELLRCKWGIPSAQTEKAVTASLRAIYDGLPMMPMMSCLAGRKKRRKIVSIVSFTGLLRRFPV